MKASVTLRAGPQARAELKKGKPMSRAEWKALGTKDRAAFFRAGGYLVNDSLAASLKDSTSKAKRP
jgi:hypothetical protein